MNDVISHFNLVLSAFWLTVQLALISGVSSIVLGTILVALRIGPLGTLSKAATLYVTLARNTPLLVVFILVFVAAPSIGWFVHTPFLIKGVLALSLYTSAFVCEALRAGVNTVSIGQAEAARGIGLTFQQNLRYVVLPQAFRASIPPLTSTLIAMTKNTSVAAAFGLLEATARMRHFTNRNADETIVIFILFAIGYILIVELIAVGAFRIERQWRATP